MCNIQYHRTWPRMRRRKLKVFIIFICIVLVTAVWSMRSGFLESTEMPAHCSSIDVVYTWVNGSDPNFLDLAKQYGANIDPARFDDKNELRFSLRSLEKYAPWVRHVYIVANQIPHWLDLSYEKVSLIPHELIAPQTDLLPTFSSAAIETFIHRIPNLSKRFLYLNDDIFLGTSLYPEDLYTESEGVQIYQAWMVPDCADDCPWTYIGDGACDLHCYVAACQFDGGDCASAEEPRVHKETMAEHNTKKNLTSIRQLNRFPIFPKSKKKSFKEYMRSHNLTVIDNLQTLVEEFNKQLNAATEDLEANKQNKILRDYMHSRNLTTTNLLQSISEKYNIQLYVSDAEIQRELKNKFALQQQQQLQLSANQSSQKNPQSTKNIYSQSLKYTNMLLNWHYGFKARNVLAHAGFLLDRDIIELMQAKFAEEVLLTASHRFRANNDLQFAFIYYSFLMNEKTMLTVEEIFDQFDTDNSGTWSDREVRTFLARMFPTVDWPAMHFFEEVIGNCSKNIEMETQDITYSTLVYERYKDSNLPTITRELVAKCSQLADAMTANFGTRPKYKYKTTTKRHAHSNFMMLTSNITQVTYELDKIRRSPRKFNCINDDLDPTQTEDNKLIRNLLEDFYFSFFPQRSKFELPENYRNRFTNWQDYRKFLLRRRAALVLAYVSTFILLFFLLRFVCLYKAKIMGRFVNRIIRI